MDTGGLQKRPLMFRNKQLLKSSKKPNSSKSIIIFLCIFLLIIGAGIGIYFAIKQNNEDEDEEDDEVLGDADDEVLGDANDEVLGELNLDNNYLNNTVIEEPTLTKEKEVYSVMKNQWQYDDAQYVCKALNSELATYDQLVEAAKNGAHWCNLGWVKTDKVGDDDGLRLAHFPIQRDLFNRQKTNNKSINKNKCGKRWNNNNRQEYNDTEHSIQGGEYSKYQNFGVNCYGIKRPISDDEKYLLHQKDELDLDEQEKLEEIKRKIGDDGLLHNLYTNYKWSRYNNDNTNLTNSNTNLTNSNTNLTNSNTNLTNSNLNLTNSK